VIATFPDDSHEPIVYPVAETRTAKPFAALYLAFLRSAAARAVFERYGFSVLLKPIS
jgi:molybdate transport system substrate-binding protein